MSRPSQSAAVPSPTSDTALIPCDNPTGRPRNPGVDDLDLLVELTLLYTKACDDKDYRLCNLIRDQVEILASGKRYGIKIETDLGLSGKLF